MQGGQLFRFPGFQFPGPGRHPEILPRPDAPDADVITAPKAGTHPGPGRGRPPVARSVTLSGAPPFPLPALQVTRPAPHAATVTALR